MLHLWAASLLWAFSFGLIKGHLTGLDPLGVAALRLAISAAVFLPWAWRHRPPRAARWPALGLGAVQFGLMYALYIAAYRHLAAYEVALWTIFTPLYVTLLADLRRRRWRPRHLAAALLAILGAAVVLVRAATPGAASGILLVQASNLCFAVGQLGYRRLVARAVPERSGDEVALLGWMYGGGTALAALGALLLADHARLAPDPGQWLVLLYLGVVPTAVGFYLWNRGAARTGAGILAVSNNLKVPLAVLVSWLVFGESAAYGRVLLGMALVTAALLVARPRRASPTQGVDPHARPVVPGTDEPREGLP